MTAGGVKILMRKFFYADAQKNEVVKTYLEKYLSKYNNINYAYVVINKKIPIISLSSLICLTIL